MSMLSRRVLPAGAAVAASLLLLTGLAAQSNQPPEEFRAFAVSLGGLYSRSGAEVVLINVNRWSSEAERTRMLDTLREKGAEQLLDAMRDTPPVGTIRTPDSLAYDLRYAHQMPAEDGGRDIVIATDRPISFWEAANRPRSYNYPFTVIQLHMPDEGPGEGKLSIATRIWESGGVISLENFGTQPVMLRDVRSTRR